MHFTVMSDSVYTQFKYLYEKFVLVSVHIKNAYLKYIIYLVLVLELLNS